MIQVENLSKKFGKNQVLNNLNLDIESGGIFAVLGPNGSGKTTLIKSILGMVVPNKGSISVLGVSIKNNWKYRQEIDYLPQIANFPGNLRVKELIRMIKDLRQMPSEEDSLITLFKLEPFLDKKLATLSGGTKQKVNIVLAFMFDCPLLILDEPTRGIDVGAKSEIYNIIRQLAKDGKSIMIFSSELPEVINICDRIFLMYDGHMKAEIENTGNINSEEIIHIATGGETV